MGTSTTGSELHSDKLAKLQARKKELEALLAAKNDDLYKLCVQEVNLTGVEPPETPAEMLQSPPEVRRDQGSEGRRTRQGHRQSSGKDAPSTSRKQISHRLSTPSISGLSIKSSPARRTDLAAASCSALAHDGRDAVSLHASQTYPSLQPPTAGYSRHHTLSSERAVKLQYASGQPAAQTFSRETHFSSSHPDISTRYSHAQLGSQAPGAAGVPLLYQFASQLKAHSPHLSAVQPRTRRGTLQRTQTYHLTAHSDHHVPPPLLASPLSPVSPLSPLSPMSPLSPLCVNSGSNPSIYSSQSGDQDQKVKEKEWYESSLDSPTGSSGMNLSKESVQYHSPKKVAPPRTSTPPPPLPPPAPSPAPVPLESPKNCTVVESGKFIPYREVSKPFEMSDFYKYSTKFRQAAARPSPFPVPSPEGPLQPPRTYSSPEQWRRAHQL